MRIIESRLSLLETVELESGAHSPDGKFCVMELVAYLADEPWSDHPACVSPVIGAFLRSWNDSLNDADRQMLKPLVPLVIGTATGKRDEETRAWMATDWLARECAPAWLRLAGLTVHAEVLEKLAPLVSAASARKAQPKLDAARKDSAAAWAAAWAAAKAAAGAAAGDAARDAAGDAAGDAAWGAAWAAARDAAGDAAGAAAWAAAGAAARAAAWAAAWAAARAAAGDAAWAAAWAAAGAALQPTVKILQTSAIKLVERMCEVGRT